MTDFTIMVGVILLLALGVGWERRRFVRAIRDEIRLLGGVVERWAQAEQQRHEHMIQSAAAMEKVIARLQEAILHTREASQGVRSNVERLNEPVAALVQNHGELTRALNNVQEQVVEISDRFESLETRARGGEPPAAGSVESLVLEMVRKRARSEGPSRRNDPSP